MWTLTFLLLLIFRGAKNYMKQNTQLIFSIILDWNQNIIFQQFFSVLVCCAKKRSLGAASGPCESFARPDWGNKSPAAAASLSQPIHPPTPCDPPSHHPLCRPREGRSIIALAGHLLALSGAAHPLEFNFLCCKLLAPFAPKRRMYITHFSSSSPNVSIPCCHMERWKILSSASHTARLQVLRHSWVC